MPNRPEFVVSSDWSNLHTGLADGAQYIVQNVGVTIIEYADAAAEPTPDIKPNKVRPFEWMEFEVDASEITWVRVLAPNGHGSLAISDKPD